MNQQTLSKFRLQRLKMLESKLGEPDLFSITKIATVHSFLSQRKVISNQQYFVAGLNFPTTAHVSSYINDKIKSQKKQNNQQSIYRVRLFVYDAYKQQDLIIQVNIPGSMELKAFTLFGKPTKVSDEDYKLGYYSSILRSLYTHPYHSAMKLYPHIQKQGVLTEFITNFIPFCKNQQSMKYYSVIECEIQQNEPCYDQNEPSFNFGLELLIKYIHNNSLWKFLPLLQKCLQNYFPVRSKLFEIQIAFLKNQHQNILILTSQYLIQEDVDLSLARKYKQYQLRSLIKLGKFSQVKILRQMLIREGFMDQKTWGQILSNSLQQGEQIQYLKLINTCSSFFLEQSKFQSKLHKLIYPQPLESDNTNQKTSKLSEFPEFCHKFNNEFLQKNSHIKTYRNALKRTQKQKTTLQILQKLDQAMLQQNFVQPYLIAFEKSVNWNKLMQLRNSCFWLQSDFVVYKNSIFKNQNLNKSYRFMNEEFMMTEQNNKEDINQLSVKKIQIQHSFECMSDSDQQQYQQMETLAPCSKRIPSKRVKGTHLHKNKVNQGKILCHFALQKTFENVYNLLKLQTDCQAWAAKLNFQQIVSLSKDKKELIAIILIKKGFLHKKLLRYRRCQESFKLVRKCTNNIVIGIVSCYQLAILYLEHKNLKGVQFYVIELVRLMYALGIQKYDIVPEWAKQTLPFITRFHPKKDFEEFLEGPLKQLVEMWYLISQKSVKKAKSPEKLKKK